MWTKNGSNYTHPKFGSLSVGNGEFKHTTHKGVSITKPLTDLPGHLRQIGHPDEMQVRSGNVTVTKPLSDAHKMV
jgi:hypothetical protein